jgi:hypothetical protein
MTDKFNMFARAGFGPDLIPILPPEAPMPDDAGGIVSKRGKVPGWLRQDGLWVGYGDWTSVVATEKDLRKWGEWPGAGVGLQARHWPAIDIDVDDEDMSRRIAGYVERNLGPAPKRTGRPPRVLMPYCLIDGDTFRKRRIELIDPDGVIHAVEFLGDGQQYVVGGLHPGTMKPYTWSKPMLAGELTKVTTGQLMAFIEKMIEAFGRVEGWSVNLAAHTQGADRTAVAQDGLAAPSPEHVIKLLEQMPNELDYDGWVRFSAAVKAAGGDVVYEAWERWCLKWPDNTQQSCAEKWDSFRPPYGVGWDYVRAIARETGVSDAENVFSVLPSSRSAAGQSAQNLPATDSEDYDNSAAKGAMFDTYCYVLDVKRFVDLRNMHLLDKEQFNASNADVGPVFSSTKCAASVYLNAISQRRLFRRLTYRPGQSWLVNEDGVTAVNTWQPATLKPWPEPVTDEDVGKWLAHLEYLVPNRRERETIIRWCAYLVQHPERKINWAVLMGGGQGIGKDLAFQPLLKIIGSQNVAQINAATIAGGYTDWAHGKKLVVVEEMHTFERKDTMNRLKPFIAAPPDELRINIKYTPQFQVPNILCMLLFTNLNDALGLEDDDRRFFVVWSDAVPRDEKYYVGLVNWYQDGGYEKIARWLADVDLPDFEAGGRAPMTAAKEDMRKASLPILNAWLEECLLDEVGPFARELIALEDVMAAMPSYVAKTRPTKEKIANILKRLGAVPLGQVRLSENHPFTGTDRLRLWAIRSKKDNLSLWTNREFVRLRAKYEGREDTTDGDILS